MLRFARNDVYAFTLAEVLITLGIIGVVSAMTVPSLMQNYQRQSYVTQLHKVYNELSQAVLSFQRDKNAVNLLEAGLDRSMDNSISFIKSYFRIINDCGNNYSPCMPENYKKIDGNSVTLNYVGSAKHKCVSLASGAGLCVFTGKGNILTQIAVDINGQKGPNIAGRDMFLMYIYNDGSIDDLVTSCTEDSSNCGLWDGTGTAPAKEERENMFNKACAIGSSPTNFHGCFGKILNDNWQMTY